MSGSAWFCHATNTVILVDAKLISSNNYAMIVELTVSSFFGSQGTCYVSACQDGEYLPLNADIRRPSLRETPSAFRTMRPACVVKCSDD